MTDLYFDFKNVSTDSLQNNFDNIVITPQRLLRHVASQKT